MNSFSIINKDSDIEVQSKKYIIKIKEEEMKKEEE
jgi:hypothetical protein